MNNLLENLSKAAETIQEKGLRGEADFIIANYTLLNSLNNNYFLRENRKRKINQIFKNE